MSSNLIHYISSVLLMVFSINANAIDATIIPSQNKNVQFIQEVEGIREFKLTNGLQILLISDENRSGITVNLVYKVGSEKESYGHKGLAHLLEHLIYTGGDTHPDLNLEYRKRNMQTMGLTSFDFTSYRTTLNASQQSLDQVLELEAARMSHFNYSHEHLNTALGEVIGEKENTDASGKNTLIRRATSSLFLWDAYGKDPIGISSDLKNITINDVQFFWEFYYRPDNASLIISGKLNEKNILSSVEKIFGSIYKAKPINKPVQTDEPVQDGEREIVIRRKRSAAALMVAYRTEPYIHPDAAAAMLLGKIFGSKEFGRLQNSLIKTKIAKRTAAYITYMKYHGALLFGVDQEYGLSIDEAKSTLIDILEKVKNEPITQEELTLAKKDLEENFIQSRRDTDALTSELNNFIGSGDWRLYFNFRERIQSMDLTTLQHIAESWFVPTNRSICILKEDEKMVLRKANMKLNLDLQLNEFTTRQSAKTASSTH